MNKNEGVMKTHGGLSTHVFASYIHYFIGHILDQYFAINL